MTAYCTLAQVKSRLSGDAPVMSGAYDQTIIDIISEVCATIDEEIRVARGQSIAWTFLPPSLYATQLVSISGAGSGSFTLTSGSSSTVPIDGDAAASNVQAALDTLLGGGNSAVTGPPGGPWLITFAGTLIGPQPVLEPASAFAPASVHATVQEIQPGSSSSSVTRRYSGTRGGAGLLLIDDAVSVSSVSILDRTGNVIQPLTAGTDFLPYPLNGTPITGLRLTAGLWPWHPGAVQVVLTPGYAPALAQDIVLAAVQESIRVLRGAQAGENDQLGVTPFGQVVVSKALLQSTLRTIGRYSYGAGFLRVPQ